MSISERLDRLSPAKRALLDSLLNTDGQQAAAPHAKPRNATETLLCEIWGSVLTVKEIGIHDRFTALGGDSIRAIQISARARRRGLSLTANHCFEYDTIARLAEYITTGTDRSDAVGGSKLPAAAANDRSVSLSEERIWVQHHLRPRIPLYNTFAGLRVTGSFDPGSFERAIDALVARHELLRTTYTIQDDQLVRHVADPAPFRLRMVDLIDATDGRTLDDVAAEETTRPFDLKRGPLFRCLCIAITQTEHVLVLVAHHIIIDAWSMRQLLRDLTRIYESMVRGYPSPLDPLSARYVDFARWQRDHVAGPMMEAERDWWHTQLADAPKVHAVPTTYDRPPKRSFQIDVLYFDFPADANAGIERITQAFHCTPYVVLLSAFHLLLVDLSRAEDMIIGTPVVGRPTEEMHDVVGFFLNTLPLRLRAGGDATVGDVIAANQETVRQSLKRNTVAYEAMISRLNLPRLQSYTPLIQLWFVLQEPPDDALKCAELRLETVELPRAYGPFELAMSVESRKDGLRGWLEFATDLFDRPTAQRIVDRYRQIVCRLDHALDENSRAFARSTGAQQ